MGHSITEYLEKMETFQLKSIYDYLSLPENADEYDYALPIIEEILNKRSKDTLQIPLETFPQK